MFHAVRRVVAGAAVLTFSASAILAGQPAQSAAPSQNLKTIAGIVAKLNHFANDAEKKTLQGIADSATATAHEKTLARALINVQHTVAAGDKTGVEALSKDQSASEHVRLIASTLARLNHTPSDAEKGQLTKLAAM
jgi:hypothetical protein